MFLFWGLIVVLWKGGWIKNYLLYISQMYFLPNYLIFTCSLRLYLNMSLSLFVYQCVVVQLSVSYANLNVSL